MTFRYGNAARSRERMVMVPMTEREARLSVDALRHVGREIFGDDPDGEVLCDASTAVREALAAHGVDVQGSRQ